MIDGVLYVTTPYNSIAALDAETGKELWRFDGEAYKLGQVLSGSGYKLRGTAFWRDGGNLRIFLNSRDRLFMLDAKTGKPVPSFGNKGEVSLTEGLPRVAESKHVHPELAAGHLQGPGHHGQPDSRSRADRRSGGPGAGDQRPHRQARVGVLGHPAVVDRRRRRDVGRRVVAHARARQCLGADGDRRGARPHLPADDHAEQRLLRRQPAGREPVRRVARLPRREHRKDEVVLPGHSPRPLGLGLPGAARTSSRLPSTASGSTPWRR